MSSDGLESRVAHLTADQRAALAHGVHERCSALGGDSNSSLQPDLEGHGWEPPGRPADQAQRNLGRFDRPATGRTVR